MLILVPAGLLVLMLLGAIAVDSAVAYLGQDQLRDTLGAAANDAATAGLDNATFYRGGTVTLDPALTDEVVCQAVAAAADRQLRDLHLSIGIQGDTVHVTGTATIDEVFGRVIPGFGRRTVRAQATAIAVEGGAAARPVRPVQAPMVPLDCGDEGTS